MGLDVADFVTLNPDSKTGFHLAAVARHCGAPLMEEDIGDFSVGPVCELLAGFFTGSGKTPAGTMFGADMKDGANAADFKECAQGNLGGLIRIFHFILSLFRISVLKTDVRLAQNFFPCLIFFQIRLSFDDGRALRLALWD